MIDWTYEVSLNVFEDEKAETARRILYTQFTKQTEAFAFAEQLMSSLYPTISAEVSITVISKT